MSAAICPCPPADAAPRFDDLIAVIQSEFGEMPGMQLTHAQFRRLWCLTVAEEQRVLERLVRAGFLVVGRDGFIRRK